jgi:diguanylate cyclase (GGDEF)-like protein
VDAVGAAAEAIAAGLRTARQFERLSFQASHDALTGLANRRTFEAFIEREIKLAERHGTALSVMVIDADHFKRYNDTYGHPAGDALLRALGARLAQVCRSTDFVARYGGEEFVVVLPHTDRAGAEVAAGKVLAGIRTMHEGAGLPGGPVTASIGVATYPADVFDARELFHAADQAMYRAKHEGRDRVCQAGA